MFGFTCELSILSHSSVCLYLYQDPDSLLTTASLYSLKEKNVIFLPILYFFLRTICLFRDIMTLVVF